MSDKSGSSSSFEDLSNIKPEDMKENEDKLDDDNDILGNGELLKKIIKKGQPDTRPVRNDIVVINLEGRLEDGTIVEDVQNFTVQVGDYEVVQAVDMIIPLMDVGEIVEVTCKSRFAYGEIGLKNESSPEKSIPPNATLIYKLELVSSKPEPDIEELHYQLRQKIGNKKRERGNFWFERNEYNLALQCYRRALDYLDEKIFDSLDKAKEDEQPTNTQLQEILEDRIKTYNNLAMAQMKVSAWDAALKSVEAVLACKPENVKALFRKGKIIEQKGNVNAAIPLLQKAATLDPENRAIQNELSKMILKSKREARNEKDLYAKMLGQAQKLEQKPKTPVVAQEVNNKFRLWGFFLGTVLVGVAGVAIYRFKYF